MFEIIPEIHTLGTFDPHTLLIELKRTRRAELIEARAGQGDARGWEIYEHECRHWRDLLSTVWGRKYIDLLFRTYDTVITTPPDRLDAAYPAVLALFDAERSILFPSYYKYVVKGAPRGSTESRWAMSFSAGARIAPDGELDKSKPLIFVRFDAGTQHVGRQPITDGALMELRAIAVETAALTEWLNMLPRDDRVVTRAVRTSELVEQLYDPELTTYSVAAHVVGFAANIRDVGAALTTGDKLADIAFNLTTVAFAGLMPGPELGSARAARLPDFRKSGSRGFAFACLAFALRHHGSPETSGRDAIERSLRAVGLPTLESIYAKARAALERIPARATVDGDLARVQVKLLEAGLALHRPPNFDSHQPPLASEAGLPAPLVADSECDMFSLGIPLLGNEETTFLHDCYERYRSVLRSALRAARGLDFEFSDFTY
jgi:hypothetical protein